MVTRHLEIGFASSPALLQNTPDFARLAACPLFDVCAPFNAGAPYFRHKRLAYR